MKKLFPSGQYKKDYKRYRHNERKKAALQQVLDMLANEQPIPSEYQPHMLTGNYKDCLECHIENLLQGSLFPFVMTITFVVFFVLP